MLKQLDNTLNSVAHRPCKMTDNAHMESFFHSFKSDVYHGLVFTSEASMRDVFRKYMPFYNQRRLHSGPGYVPTVQYEIMAAWYEAVSTCLGEHPFPEFQRQGIGKALIQEGLSRLNDMNARGCCFVGHPDYYRKFGFKNVSDFVCEGVPQEVFFALSFDGHMPHGEVTFHEAFNVDG